MIFVGLVAPWSGIEEALGALASLAMERPDAHLTVLGPCGPAYEGVLREIVARLSLGDRVDWRGERPREEVAAALPRAGIGLASFRSHPLRIHAAPLKLLEYMASGLPVIALDGSAAGDLVVATGTGVVAPTTGEAIAEAARRLLSDHDAYRRMSVAGPEVAADHDWDVVLDREFDRISALSAVPRGAPA
jgi:glycosyltransferase involved in cell wall biosynthesis